MIFCDTDVLLKLKRDKCLDLLISFAKNQDKIVQITDEIHNEIIDRQSKNILGNLLNTNYVVRFNCPTELQKRNCH